MVTNLSTLESRIVDRLESNESVKSDESPESDAIDRSEAVGIIEEEFARFESETDAMSDDPDAIGQARLNEHEISRLPMGNQHTQWNTIRWQCVKAAAIYYGVTDWTSKVDSSLTYEENITLMSKYATQNTDTTVREMKPAMR